MLSKFSGKALTQSGTFWAALGVIIVSILGAYGVHVSEGDQTALVTLITTIVEAVLAVAAIVFRYTAKKEITSVLPPAPATKTD